MIESIEFKNFKALRDAKLPLSQFTLIVGPNGSGKSTALSGVMALGHPDNYNFGQLRTLGTQNSPVQVTATWSESGFGYRIETWWSRITYSGPTFTPLSGSQSTDAAKAAIALNRVRFYSLDANAISQSMQLQPQMEMAPNGGGLAVVLDRLRDQHPERFEALNNQLGQWIPEFNRILFDTAHGGHRSISLRTREGGHSIRASDLSQGTLVALALLTIAYLPDPPAIVCLEEPDHGLHPRLLRDVRDALYRLAYPEGAHEKREPVQVIATTHNPYFLDLFREHPEEIVIAEKVGLEAKFSRLSDRQDLDEILGDAPLSEVWYSGVLGGVPAGT
jgi:Predicted ATPase